MIACGLSVFNHLFIIRKYAASRSDAMKILLISDIHANIYALHAVEQAEKSWDEVWCCGDLVDFGPDPTEVIRWMQDHNARCVLGNHDAHVLRLTPEDCRRAWDERTWQWAHQNYEQLSDSDLAYLRSLPKTLHLAADGIPCQMQHQYDNGYGTVESQEQFDRFWQGESAPQRRLIFGHTHRRCLHALSEGALWLNPGSISYRRPDDPDKRAHYMVIEDGHVRFGAVSYDRRALLGKTQEIHRSSRMLTCNLQDAYFFFGSASTTRDPLPTLPEL
jgi:predicted phosphodiesterase